MESIQELCFRLFTIFALVGSLGTVFFPNLVYAAFFLGVTLVSIAGFYLLLNADFLAAAQILLYVGGINILILFAIMLVDANARVTRPTREEKPFWILQGSFVGVLFLLLTQAIQTTLWVSPPFVPITNTVYSIGRHIFSDFLFPFELVSILLLIALIGVVVLAKREPLASSQEGESSLFKR